MRKVVIVKSHRHIRKYKLSTREKKCRREVGVKRSAGDSEQWRDDKKRDKQSREKREKQGTSSFPSSGPNRAAGRRKILIWI